MVALGLLFAYYAYASSNTPPNPRSDETLVYDYQKQHLFNTPGEPVEVDWEKERARFAPKPPKLVRTNYCSCVTYAKVFSGINVGPIGFAKYHPVNSNIPSIGAIVKTSEGPYGHVAVVIGITETTITVSEANYIRCRKGTRTLPINSPVIRGYYEI